MLLGTASWGNDYGLLNSRKLGISEAKVILREALRAGINGIDTAPDYGDSEMVLGKSDLRPFRVFTKISQATWSNELDRNSIQFRRSLSRLGLESAEGATFHSAESFLSTPTTSLELIESLKDAGLIKSWGVSVYSEEELISILAVAAPDYIQAPVNLIDRRFLQPRIANLMEEKKCKLQARSIFLQGLLLKNVETLPRFFQPLKELLSSHKWASREGQLTPYVSALLFVLMAEPVDTLVVGVNELEHLTELTSAMKLTSVLPDFRHADSKEELYLVDPRNW